MSDSVETLMLANLLEVFNQRNAGARRVAIERTYTDSVRWIDSDGEVTGREALNAKCVELQANLTGLQFAAAGPVYQLQGFGYLAWSLVDGNGDLRMSGFDVALIRGGLIAELYTVLTPPLLPPA